MGTNWFDYLLPSAGQQKAANDLQLLLNESNTVNEAGPFLKLSTDGTILCASRKLIELVGYAENDLVGHSINDLLDRHGNLSNQQREFVNRLSRADAYSGELKFLNKAGTAVWLNVHSAPVKVTQGKSTEVVVLAQDITALVAARDEASRLRVAVDNAQTAIMMVDRDFIVTYVNKQTVALLTKHSEAFRQKWPTFEASKMIGTCIDLFHKNPAHQRQMLSDPSRLPYRTDIRIGELIISLTVSATVDSEGKYIGNTLEWADVTEIRRQEALNTDYRGQIASISRSQAVIEFTVDGNIVNANENFLRTLGYSLDEIKGKHHSMFVDPTFASSAEYRKFWTDLAAGQSFAADFMRIGKGGREVWIRASYNPILDNTGKPFKVVKYASDITAAKIQEREVAEAKERMQSLPLKSIARLNWYCKS